MAEAAENAPVTENVSTDAQGVETEHADWRTEAGIAHDPNFEKFNSPADLAKSYAELQSMMGRSVRIPTEDASPEDRQAFLEKLGQVDGVMPTPEGYEPPPAEASAYTFEEVEGFSDPESEGAFKTIAHEQGLTRAQAGAIHNWLAGNIVSEQKQAGELSEKLMSELKGEWGQAFDHKLQGAANTAKALEQKVPGIGQFFDQMANSGYDANFIRLMDVVGEMLGESGAMKTDPRTTMTRQEAQDRIDDIRNNFEHPANNEMHPNYDHERAKLMELYKVAFS